MGSQVNNAECKNSTVSQNLNSVIRYSALLILFMWSNLIQNLKMRCDATVTKEDNGFMITFHPFPTFCLQRNRLQVNLSGTKPDIMTARSMTPSAKIPRLISIPR